MDFCLYWCNYRVSRTSWFFSALTSRCVFLDTSVHLCLMGYLTGHVLSSKETNDCPCLERPGQRVQHFFHSEHLCTWSAALISPWLPLYGLMERPAGASTDRCSRESTSAGPAMSISSSNQTQTHPNSQLWAPPQGFCFLFWQGTVCLGKSLKSCVWEREVSFSSEVWL